MKSAFSFYVIFEVLLIILAVISYLYWDKRYGKNHGTDIPEGFEKTGEITIDPIDGRKLRVYYNSKTGERCYIEEKLGSGKSFVVWFIEENSIITTICSGLEQKMSNNRGKNANFASIFFAVFIDDTRYLVG
jgi:hypothetical protein